MLKLKVMLQLLKEGWKKILSITPWPENEKCVSFVLFEDMLLLVVVVVWDCIIVALEDVVIGTADVGGWGGGAVAFVSVDEQVDVRDVRILLNFWCSSVESSLS